MQDRPGAELGTAIAIDVHAMSARANWLAAKEALDADTETLEAEL